MKIISSKIYNEHKSTWSKKASGFFFGRLCCVSLVVGSPWEIKSVNGVNSGEDDHISKMMHKYGISLTEALQLKEMESVEKNSTKKYSWLYEELFVEEDGGVDLVSFKSGLKAIGVQLSERDMEVIFKLLCGYGSFLTKEIWVDFMVRKKAQQDKPKKKRRKGRSGKGQQLCAIMIDNLKGVNAYSLCVHRLFKDSEVRESLFRDSVRSGVLKLPTKENYDKEWRLSTIKAERKRSKRVRKSSCILGEGANGALYRVSSRENPEIKRAAKFCDCEDEETFWLFYNDFLFLQSQRMSERGGRLIFYSDIYYDESAEKCILVMKQLQYNLTQRVEESPPGGEEQRKIACDLFQQLQEFHRSNLIHRDIKPSNIMFDQEENRWKLIDFDFVSECDEKGFEDESFCGTVGYAPLEIDEEKGGKYTFSYDVWSCGVTLLFLITGEQVFYDEELYARFCACDSNARKQLWMTNYLKNLQRKFKISESMFELLNSHLLRVQSEQRATVDKVLQHPWLRGEKYPLAVLPESNSALE